jgi:alkylation response protein AidB-like acyl-CoA dehydrogenase
LDFSLTEAQEALKKSIAEFSRKELGGDVRAREKEGTFFRDGWDRCAAFGIQGLPMPAEYGGTGESIVECMIAMQALGATCQDSGLLFALSSHMWTCEIPVLLFGSAAQKERFLPAMIRGEIIGCHAMSEPGSGSDAFSLRTLATKVDGGYRITGGKTFISNAPIAGLFLVFATVNPKKGWAGVTGFLVERDNPGLTIGKPLDKMGLKTSPTGEIHLEDCFVPDDMVLGKVGGGSAIFNAEMEWERSCLFAAHLGAMQRQLDTCVTYAKERKQFGQSIGSFQAISHKIADMRVRIEIGEMLLHKVAWAKAKGQRASMESAISKLFVSEAYVASSLDAIQIHGGYGFMTEVEVERDLRDAIGGKLYSGTSEIQRNIIASLLGL